MRANIHGLRLLAVVTGFGAMAAVRAEGVVLPETPSSARPGECFGLVYTPPQYVTRAESVVVTPASERVVTTPAQYEWTTESVTVPAGKRRKIVKPAVVETMDDTVTVPGRRRTVAVPATYRTVDEVETVRSGAILKPGKRLEQEGSAFCLVEAPATQKTVRRQVIDRPASTRTVVEPPRQRTIKRSKVLVPATTMLVDVPERTVKRRVRKLVSPAAQHTVLVPARMGTVERRDLVSPGHADWKSVLCETNFTPGLTQRLQEALRQQGLYRGAADGHRTAMLDGAVRAYQTREGLPTDGVTLDLLAHLGVPLSDGAGSANP